jgi:hypothetical protein
MSKMEQMKRIVLMGLLGSLTLGRALAADESGTNRPPVVSASATATVVVTEAPGPSTDEIIKALREHYVDRNALDPKKLNDASVAGIIQMLGAGAKLLTTAEAASNTVMVVEPPAASREPLARAEVIDPAIGYIRVADLTAETPLALDDELKKFAQAKVSGYILDLRFADGTNYAIAATVASRFLSPGTEVFTLKKSNGAEHTFHTTPAPKTLDAELTGAPLMLLVNAQTRGSAEVLVGALRRQNRGIVVGSPTAGLPVEWDDIHLPDGWILRLAATKISFPKGGESFPSGVIPDIMVKIDLKAEQDAVFNLSTNVTLTASLQPRQRRRDYSEAALVKVFRGESIDAPTLQLSQGGSGTASNALTLSGEAPAGTNGVARTEEENDMQPGRDIVLQRAVDVLKGIRVLLSWQ